MKKICSKPRKCKCENPDPEICKLLLTWDCTDQYAICQIYGDLPMNQPEFEAILIRNGWRYVRSSGSSHSMWEHEKLGRRPMSWSRHVNPPRSFLKSLCKKFSIPLGEVFKDMKLKGAPPSAPRSETTFGGIVTQARVRAKTSQALLGDALGITQTNVSLLERDLREPTIDIISGLEKYLDFTEDEMKVIKGVRESLIVAATGPLPGQVEDAIVEPAAVEPRPHEEPEREAQHHTVEPEKQRKLAKQTVTWADPVTGVKTTIAEVPSAESTKVEPAPMGEQVASWESKQVARPMTGVEANRLKLSDVTDWIRQVVMENMELKERLAEFESVDINALRVKAHKYDQMLELFKQ